MDMELTISEMIAIVNAMKHYNPKALCLKEQKEALLKKLNEEIDNQMDKVQI
jgi:hypothetical protein